MKLTLIRLVSIKIHVDVHGLTEHGVVHVAELIHCDSVAVGIRWRDLNELNRTNLNVINKKRYVKWVDHTQNTIGWLN